MALGTQYNPNQFQFGNGAGNDYGFSTGLPNTSMDYGSLNGFGQPSPTLGANTAGLFGGGTPNATGGFGLNIPTFQLGLQGVSSLANLYTGLKSLGLAQDQFNFQKGITQQNLANQTQSYNTALTDRATARGVTEGQSSDQVQAYINANKLKG